MKNIDLSYDRTRRGPKPLYKRIAGRIVFSIAWVLATILWPLKVVIYDFCYMGLIRLFSPVYKEHMYWLGLQNQHLDGLHPTGPEPGCAYCDTIVLDLANGGYYRPWIEAGWTPDQVGDPC